IVTRRIITAGFHFERPVVRDQSLAKPRGGFWPRIEEAQGADARRRERRGDRRADAAAADDESACAVDLEALAAQAAHEALAVEKIALQAAVLAAHRVARAGDLHRRRR